MQYLRLTRLRLQMDSGFKYDLFVVGGGSGGLATSKAAAKLGQRVGLADFVQPSPQGSKWGLGGTCVNVGCIPKKLYHFAAQIGELRKDQIEAGWNGIDLNGTHDWGKMSLYVRNYIQRLNNMHRQFLEDNKVTYYNKYARFVDAHTLELTDAQGEKETVTAKHVLIAVGSRPTIPDDISDLASKVITSDDLFFLSKAPGKTLVVGASYVALEGAGFIHGLGQDTTVIVRSVLLRGFDQEMAQRVGNFMKERGIKFIEKSVPSNVEVLPDGKRLVSWEVDGTTHQDTFDTVIYAVGRTAATAGLNLEAVGVKVAKNQKVICSDDDRTSAENIFAVGDCVEGRLELTPTAVMCGRRLARRLYAGGNEFMDYADVATTVFTPLEYGSVGMSEETARAKFGSENVRVFYGGFKPTTWNFNAERNPRACYGKLIVHKQTDQVVGLHYCGPDAAEVTQGYGVAIKMRATKKDFDNTVGIHPSASEEMVQMTQTKPEQ